MGFVDAYALRVGAGMDVTDQVQFGIAPEHLYPDEVARLMGAGSYTEAGDLDLVCSALRNACVRGILKSRETRYEPDGSVIQDGRVDYLIYWRNVTEYFKSLGLEPDVESVLSLWLTGPITTDNSERLATMNALREEFETKCIEHWQTHPHAKIGGKTGVVSVVGEPYIKAKRCHASTLEIWAKNIASPSALKRGRPRKSAK